MRGAGCAEQGAATAAAVAIAGGGRGGSALKGAPAGKSTAEVEQGKKEDGDEDNDVIGEDKSARIPDGGGDDAAEVLPIAAGIIGSAC